MVSVGNSDKDNELLATFPPNRLQPLSEFRNLGACESRTKPSNEKSGMLRRHLVPRGFPYSLTDPTTVVQLLPDELVGKGRPTFAQCKERAAAFKVTMSKRGIPGFPYSLFAVRCPQFARS